MAACPAPPKNVTAALFTAAPIESDDVPESSEAGVNEADDEGDGTAVDDQDNDKGGEVHVEPALPQMQVEWSVPADNGAPIHTFMFVWLNNR